MIIPQVKRLINNAIVAHKWRRFRKRVCEPLDSQERALLLPYAYFVAQGSVHVVYDIGAAKGVFSTGAAKFKNIDQVVAFEPLPASYERLVKNVAPFKKIQARNIAIGDKSGTVDFFVTRDGDASSCLAPNSVHNESHPDRLFVRNISVESACLDDAQKSLGLPFADLIKIDTQGFEMSVLRGAEHCLTRAQYCIVECSYAAMYDGSALIGDVVQFFSGKNWRLVGASEQSCDAAGRPLQVDLVFARSLAVS